MTDREPDELPSQYAPAEVEARRYEHWEKAGYFTPEAQENENAPSFSIVLPPPNVTGSLHIGHALDHTLSDALVRRRRMQGYRTLWLPGMDHAGIATQNVVERELAKDGLSRHDLGREAFVERVWQWKTEYGGRILGQMRRLGDSVDWSRERFTMDEGLSRAVQTIFKRLFDDELIYRAERIINWCPRCLTALSDIEVDHPDDEGELVSIRYGDGANSIVVATTRAETMLGDTAVAVHPDDERYTHLVGTVVELPLTGRAIPIVADAHVDPAFGTGAVKVTPAHDPNDFEIGRRHDLPGVPIMDERGVITAAGPFQGLDRFEARPAIVAALREAGRIVKEVRPYVHAVGHCSRCGTTVEPRQSLQWFVRVAPLAKAAGDAVRDGRVALSPIEMNARYFGWVDDMHDWCISRQLWWGHRIPVWYSPDGEARCVGPNETPPPGWTQDPDVLDTWFSSALWPFSTLGWPDDTPDLRAFYPTSVLVTGYDILFFWVVRMMMFGLYANRGKAPQDAVPFRNVVLHGLVRDQFGKKMSKSRGNTVDPLEWIDRFGADAVRFTLARGSNPGSDTAISEEWAAGSRNFCNKLWNATRFALLNGATVDGQTGTNGPFDTGKSSTPDHRQPGAELAVADRWILSRLSAVIAEVDGLLEQFEFGKACDALYHFAWDEFCDWYLELAKVPLAAAQADGAGEAAVQAGRPHQERARVRARPDAAAAAPGHAVRHRRAVDGPDRPGLGDDGGLADVRGRRQGGRGRDRVADAAGDRDPPVPCRPGAATGPAGSRPPHRDRRHPAGRPRGVDQVAAPADRPGQRRRHGRRGRRVQRLRVADGRGRHRGTRPGRDRGRGGRARADGEGSRGRPQGGGADGRQARELGLHRQGAGRRGGQVAAAPGRRRSRHRPAGSPPRLAGLIRRDQA